MSNKSKELVSPDYIYTFQPSGNYMKDAECIYDLNARFNKIKEGKVNLSFEELLFILDQMIDVYNVFLGNYIQSMSKEKDFYLNKKNQLIETKSSIGKIIQIMKNVSDCVSDVDQ